MASEAAKLIEEAYRKVFEETTTKDDKKVSTEAENIRTQEGPEEETSHIVVDENEKEQPERIDDEETTIKPKEAVRTGIPPSVVVKENKARSSTKEEPRWMGMNWEEETYELEIVVKPPILQTNKQSSKSDSGSECPSIFLS